MAVRPSRALLIIVFVAAMLGGLALGRALSGAPEAAAGSCTGDFVRQWAWRESSLQAYGVDGYVRHPGGSLADPDCSFLAHYIAVADRASPVGSNVQVGLTIGVLPNPPGGVPTTYKIYSDGVNNCDTYSLANHGSPTASNAPYYLSYTQG
jgi:hypothetical protein